MRILAPREAVPRLSRRALLGGATVLASAAALSACDTHTYAATAKPDGSP